MQYTAIFYEVLDCLISEIDHRFSSESCTIFCGISALCPGSQSFLSEKTLQAYANAYSISQYDLQHEIPLVKKLLNKEPKQPNQLWNFFVFFNSI